MKKVTAGRDELGELAPKFAELNDDILFGEVWSREAQLSLRDRSMITVTALMASGIIDSSLKAHLSKAQENGVTREEMVEVITHTAFYAGWPKAWATFYMMQEIYDEKQTEAHVPYDSSIFGLGEKNEVFAQYFQGQSYLSMLLNEPVSIAHVTFEPECRNHWHIHHNGGQILLVTGGFGWYQEFGKEPRYLKKGDVVNIPPEVKHWHGAVKASWFSHLAIEVPAVNSTTEWLEEVSDETYHALRSDTDTCSD